MFQFMKKSSTKDKEDKKKREDGSSKGQTMTQEELNRLEEARNALQRKQVGADDDGSVPQRVGSITKPIKPGSFTRTDSASRKVPPPVTQPKPPKKGILKDKSNYGGQIPNHGVRGSLDDTATLEENTLANEILSGQAVDESKPPSVKNIVTSFDHTTGSSPAASPAQRPVPTKRQKPSPVARLVKSPSVTMPSKLSIDVAKEPPIIVMRPPSPVDKSYDNVNLQLPGVSAPFCPQPRNLVLRRQPAGDFGFTLRKGAILERGSDESTERKRAVIFAEPGTSKTVNTGLLPGDRLIEVNDVNVESMAREGIIELIKNSGESVHLKVQPIPELSELSMRSGVDGECVSIVDQSINSGTLQRSGSMRLRQRQAKTEDQIASDKAWLSAEKVWLVHRGGFAAARVLPGAEAQCALPEGKCQVKLEHGGEVLTVDDEDVEKANPPQFDRVEDLASLRTVNESCVLHTLRQRYGSNLIHSYAGQSLVIINPMHPLSIYTEKVIHMFKGCKPEDMPPHIFATAQIAYRNMLNTRRDQSIVLMGHSGGGKTTNAHNVLLYYATAYGTTNGVLTGYVTHFGFNHVCQTASKSNHLVDVEKLSAIFLLLDAFGNSRTVMNTSSTNFTQITSVDFDSSGYISSASIQTLMLEKNRVVRRPEGEPSFHVLYYMLAGLDSALRKELHLENLTDPNIYMTPLQRTEDRQKATAKWAQILHALTLVKITDDEMKAIFSVMAAIYHLGVAGTTKGVSNKFQFARPASAQSAADVLGTSLEELSRAVFGTGAVASQSLSPGYRSPGDKEPPSDTWSGVEALESFVVGLYSDTFQSLVTLINRSLSSNYRSISSVLVVDTPGFRNPALCGRQSGANFEELCHNYVQERLQLLFHETVFTTEQDLYAQENVECDFEQVVTSPAPIVLLIDQPQQGLVRSPKMDQDTVDQKGLLWMLDEEAISSGTTDETFLNEVLHQHCTSCATNSRDTLLSHGTEPGTFVVNHFQGTSPVQYNTRGWLKACRENPIMRTVTSLLQDSKRSEISTLYLMIVRPGITGTMTGSSVGIEAGASLRRVSSRSFASGSAGVKRRSVCIQVKLQTDALIEMIRRTRMHFVHCLLPQYNAGLCELRPSNMAAAQENSQSDATDGATEDVMLSVPFLRSQIRGAETLEAIKIHRQGFPEHMQFAEFRRRFEILASSTPKPDGLDEKQSMLHLLSCLDVDKLSYKLGLSQVFFRAGSLAQLEYAREEKVTGWVVGLQAICRGYLGRTNRQKIKLQHLAVACIQRNVRKLMDIREWPWWRLYVKVKPLLNVQRTEDELKDREVQLEQMKLKLEKVEKERLEYKQAAERFEIKLADIVADYQDEQSTSTQAGEQLEKEAAERIRLEKELKDTQMKLVTLQKVHERTEADLINAQMFASSLDDELDDVDDSDNSVLRERFERLRKECEYSKRKLQQEHEEEIEQWEGSKKQLERKLAEVTAEAEEQSRTIAAMKRKAQRFNQDMADMKLHLEEQVARNAELEKKQRKFDAELAKVNDMLRMEKSQREKLQRERDELSAQKYTVELRIKDLDLDLEMEREKSARLDRELNDVTGSGSAKDDKELLKLKQLKNELERKAADQEEELDEQAGKIQQLEQAKLRLEMGQEKLRQQHVKELEDKENDLQELKATLQKKLKTMELQMEEEHEDRQKSLREKRELERRLQALADQKPARDKDVEHQLKRDLKRTKALLQDAQLMLQKYKDGAGNRNVIKQLRNQLEDAEFATAAAVKARKGVEMEVQDLHRQLEDMTKAKQDVEERCAQYNRDKNELQSRLEENEEELGEIMKKYKSAVQQHSVDLITFQDQSRQIETLLNEKEALKEELTMLQNRSDYLHTSAVDRESVTRLEVKIRDLETKLEFEQSSRHRAETQLSRIKEQLETEQEEKQNSRAEESRKQEATKRLQRQVRELEEEANEIKHKEADAVQRRTDLEKKLENLQADYDQSQNDLQLAFKRIADLQAVIEDDVDAADGDSDDLEDSSDYAGAYNSNSDSDAEDPGNLLESAA